jgi:hypothetical protein
MTQLLPFADPTVLRIYEAFEAGVYAAAEAPFAERRAGRP